MHLSANMFVSAWVIHDFFSIFKLRKIILHTTRTNIPSLNYVTYLFLVTLGLELRQPQIVSTVQKPRPFPKFSSPYHSGPLFCRVSPQYGYLNWDTENNYLDRSENDTATCDPENVISTVSSNSSTAIKASIDIAARLVHAISFSVSDISGNDPRNKHQDIWPQGHDLRQSNP